jgi:very-short-patch-repair endonuclease
LKEGSNRGSLALHLREAGLRQKSMLISNNVNLARKLRNSATKAEAILWGSLRRKQTGFKFRRQTPLGPYIVDFYCPKLRLVIEVDGAIHTLDNIQERDKLRQKFLEDNNLIVIRFWNHQIFEDIDSVMERIIYIANQIVKLKIAEGEELRKTISEIKRLSFLYPKNWM